MLLFLILFSTQTESTGGGDKDEWGWDEKAEDPPQNTHKQQSFENTEDHFNEFQNDDEDDWQTDWNEQNVENTTETSDYMTQVKEIMNKSNKTPEKQRETKTVEPKTKGMSLSSKTKAKVTSNDNKDTNKSNITQKKTDLGDEFSIKIKQDFSSEPDYFADMIPDFKEKKTVLIETKANNVNSKFQAATDDSQVGFLSRIFIQYSFHNSNLYNSNLSFSRTTLLVPSGTL